MIDVWTNVFIKIFILRNFVRTMTWKQIFINESSLKSLLYPYTKILGSYELNLHMLIWQGSYDIGLFEKGNLYNNVYSREYFKSTVCVSMESKFLCDTEAAEWPNGCDNEKLYYYIIFWRRRSRSFYC